MQQFVPQHEQLTFSLVLCTNQSRSPLSPARNQQLMTEMVCTAVNVLLSWVTHRGENYQHQQHVIRHHFHFNAQLNPTAMAPEVDLISCCRLLLPTNCLALLKWQIFISLLWRLAIAWDDVLLYVCRAFFNCLSANAHAIFDVCHARQAETLGVENFRYRCWVSLCFHFRSFGVSGVFRIRLNRYKARLYALSSYSLIFAKVLHSSFTRPTGLRFVLS